MSAVSEAVAAARNGAGPQLLEMKTYRYAGHSRADAATYRPPGELEEWQARDPIALAADILMESGATQKEFDDAAAAVERSVDGCIEEALAAPVPDHEAMFRNVWADTDSP